jgi:hypothetical protein
LASRVDDRFGKKAVQVEGGQVGDAAVGERAELLEEGFAKKFWINHGKKGAFGWSI